MATSQRSKLDTQSKVTLPDLSLSIQLAKKGGGEFIIA